MQAKKNSQRGQGSLEYLLLLAAAVVVVSIVIAFLIGVIGPTKDTGNQQTFDFECKTLNTNSLTCGCYECNEHKGGLYNGNYVLANKTDCNSLAVTMGNSGLMGNRCGALIPEN